MIVRAITLCWILLLLPPVGVYGAEPRVPEVHVEVIKALAWELPVTNCVRPKMPGFRQEVHDVQGTTIDYWDVDSYTFKRYQRKEKRWQRCIDRYKAGLKDDFDALRKSAQYGLTESQAKVILGKMKMIQSVLMSPAGVVPAASEPER